MGVRKLSIYVVETVGDEVFVVVASSANEAAAAAFRHIRRREDSLGRTESPIDDPDTYAVGRVGTYEPGPSGAVMGQKTLVYE